MKQNKMIELLSILVSLILALGAFLILFVLLKWELILCMALSAVIYLAVTFLLKPIKKIGKVDVNSLSNGEALCEKLGEAKEDYERMKKAAAEIHDGTLQKQCRELVKIAGSILKYLTDNPQKISAARRYIDYYQETAANALEHYLKLQDMYRSRKEMETTLSNMQETIKILRTAFEAQLEKLMQNEMMDMEADLNLLKQTLRFEGYDIKEKEADVQ